MIRAEVREQVTQEQVKRKRKLIVRDWFFYVVWYVRLRKLLSNFYSEELMEKEIEQNKEKYEDLMNAVEKGKDGVKLYLDKNSLKKPEETKQDKSQKDGAKRWDEYLGVFKFQGISFHIYEDAKKYETKDK